MSKQRWQAINWLEDLYRKDPDDPIFQEYEDSLMLPIGKDQDEDHTREWNGYHAGDEFQDKWEVKNNLIKEIYKLERRSNQELVPFDGKTSEEWEAEYQKLKEKQLKLELPKGELVTGNPTPDSFTCLELAFPKRELLGKKTATYIKRKYKSVRGGSTLHFFAKSMEATASMDPKRKATFRSMGEFRRDPCDIAYANEMNQLFIFNEKPDNSRKLHVDEVVKNLYPKKIEQLRAYCVRKGLSARETSKKKSELMNTIWQKINHKTGRKANKLYFKIEVKLTDKKVVYQNLYPELYGKLNIYIVDLAHKRMGEIESKLAKKCPKFKSLVFKNSWRYTTLGQKGLMAAKNLLPIIGIDDAIDYYETSKALTFCGAKLKKETAWLALTTKTICENPAVFNRK